MPERSAAAPALRPVGDESVRAGRVPTQMGWYDFARRFVKGKAVLDVGCGTGSGLQVLRKDAARAEGQDLDPRLAGPGVHIGTLEEIPDNSFDVITSIDVIEHVEDVDGYLGQLSRIARNGFFLSTPNCSYKRWEPSQSRPRERQYQGILFFNQGR